MASLEASLHSLSEKHSLTLQELEQLKAEQLVLKETRKGATESRTGFSDVAHPYSVTATSESLILALVFRLRRHRLVSHKNVCISNLQESRLFYLFRHVLNSETPF